MKMEKIEMAIELIETAYQQAIEHPAFIGLEKADVEQADIEGGDAAFVTVDMAYNLQKALDLLNGEFR